MRKIRMICLAMALACLAGMVIPTRAVDVDSDSVYCFTTQDFSEEEKLAGICITQLPESQSGTLMLGTRVLRAGDILTARQLEQMQFNSLESAEDLQAQMLYLPIYENRVEQAAVMTFSIRGKADHPPVAQDSALETYKNLPNRGKLVAADPEEQPLTYTLVRQPRRGTVELEQDGTFTYTPKKNKVGVDSFTFTAADPAGNVSREATVTVQILKPMEAGQYRDTIGLDCRFAAEWLRNTGLFAGENVGGKACFYPEQTVSRGEFLTMLVELLELPVEEVDAPDWMQPYLDAAIRSGLVAGWQQESFDMTAPVTGAEAAVALQNALDLPAEDLNTQVFAQDTPQWAVTALAILAANGLELEAGAPMTRGQTARVLYQVSREAMAAPGMPVFHLQD